MKGGCVVFVLSAVLFLMCGTVSAASGEEIPSYKVGDIEVYLLSEGDSEGNSSLFVGADEEMLEKYVPDGKYSTAINVFLVRTPEKTFLVDTGFGKNLFGKMKALGVEPEGIDAVLLTHMHGDHIGGLMREKKRAFPKARIYLARQERDYWTDEEAMKKLPEGRQGGFRNAQETLGAYGEDVETFDPGILGEKGEHLFPGVAALAAFGHTPGHTLFLLESGDSSLLIWGDLTHAMAIQMPVPDVAMVYDVDPAMAVASRKAVLKYVDEKGIPVAGMHIPSPVFGSVTSSGKGGYSFAPVSE